MAGRINPGHYHLPLPFNNRDLNKDAIKKKLDDIESDLEARKGRTEDFAILNIIGLLKYRLERYKEAEKDFRAILSQDSCNLNALANMQFLLKKVYRKEEGGTFQSKLNAYLSESTEDSIRMKARCLAEQAYAYACDMHTDNAGRERYTESSDIFQKALDLGGDLIDAAEIDIWKFCMAKNAHKLFDKFTYGEDYPQAVHYMDTAVKLFHEIAQKDPGDPEYQCEVWRHLGDIFRKVKVRKQFPTIHLPDDLKKFFDDPEECMRKALDNAPSDSRRAKILARYANFISSLRRDNTRALRLLDESISLDDSGYNFYAFSMRGAVRLKFYKWQLRQAKENSEGRPQPDKSLLKLALRDMERATEIRNAPWDLLHMAEVYHRLVEDTDEPKKTKREYLEREFECLTRADDIEDGGRPTHVKRQLGRCLFDLGHYRESIERYKEAMDVETATSEYTGHFHELFRSYLCLLRGDPKADAPYDEMVDSLRQALEKYGRSALLKYCFGPLRIEYKHELKLCSDYCRTIPNNEGLLKLLTANEPPSLLGPPPRPGGLLKDSWENPENQEDNGRIHVGYSETSRPKDIETSDSKSSDSLGASSRPSPCLNEASKGATSSPDDGLETPSETAAAGAAAPLESEIRSLTINETSFGETSEDTLDKKIQYDFFVVYARSSEDWVHEELLPKMEDRQLKGCTGSGDGVAGSFVISSEIELMSSSACILFVITDDFKKDGQFLMHHALDLRKGGHAIFPINRDGSAPPKELKIFRDFSASQEGEVWDKLAQDIKCQRDVAREALIKHVPS